MCSEGCHSPSVFGGEEDAPLSHRDLEPSPEGRMGTLLHPEEPHSASPEHSPFLQMLADAESAANAAATQLISFKDALDKEFTTSRQNSSHKSKMMRQRKLLLEKLEDFKRINKSVRQTLKQLQQAEAEQVHAEKQVHNLLTRISLAENENEVLKRDLCKMGKRVEELNDLRKEEQDSVKSSVSLSKSVEATRAHLQGQLRSKEAENNRLSVQLRTLERTVIQHRLEMEDMKATLSALKEKAAADKEALKRAVRAQRVKAERCQATVDQCYAQLQEKDAELVNTRLQSESKKRHQELMTDEKDKLLSQITFLKSQIIDLNARLLKERDDLTANENMMQQFKQLTAENGDLSLNNATLKASVAQLETQLAESEAALVEERLSCQEKSHEAKQLQRQVEDLQADIVKTRLLYAGVLKQIENTQRGRGAEVDKVACQRKLLSSSEEMKTSIHEGTSRLQEKVHSLQMELDRLQQENTELVRRLGLQEDAVGFSQRELDQRSAEVQALSRQLHNALSDVKEQINKVKAQADYREDALQTRILELEAEICRRDKEVSLLRQTKITAEKQFEVRLKELQLSLDQSESHKQSIQNYMDFLKNSYTTMFDEGLQATCFTSSYFLK